MAAPVYPACVRELYESEIFGEELGLALWNAAKNERDRYHFGTLLQLESETKVRLRPLLAKHGISLSEDMDLSDIGKAVAAYEASGLKGFLDMSKPVMHRFIRRFKQIAEVGAPEDRSILESMVRHEEAILAWAEAESDGPAEQSLEKMRQELRHPLPVPSGNGVSFADQR